TTRSNRLSPSGCIGIRLFVTMVLLQYDSNFSGLLALGRLILKPLFHLSRRDRVVKGQLNPF
ncbi:MAG: hypothetical protein KKH45_08225, partial [Proteobacteria bacterium]|nr:hypothetical protein [Pseudomonadota bacterium]